MYENLKVLPVSKSIKSLIKLSSILFIWSKKNLLFAHNSLLKKIPNLKKLQKVVIKITFVLFLILTK